MPRVAMVQVVFNSMRFIPSVFPAALAQTYPDTELYAVIAGDDDGSKSYIETHFPQVRIIDPGYNIGFARGHNELFSSIDAPFFQLVNPDLLLRPDYIEKLMEIMESDQRVGGCCGKLLRYDFDRNAPGRIIDSTGVIVHRSGRAYDRGQHQVDDGQYEKPTSLLAVSGAAALFRREALDDVVSRQADGHREYFDETFHSYWEDVDLSWRMVNSGWQNRYCPKAVAHHGRAVPSSPGGYRKVAEFVRHRRSIDPAIRRLNYRNHVFLFVKNSPKWYWKFFARELFYNLYILFFETSTLREFPALLRGLQGMLQKRKQIRSRRKISIEDMEKLMAD